VTLGENAAKLKYEQNLTWREVGKRLGVSRDKARSAARRYLNTHEKQQGGKEQIERDERPNETFLSSKSRRIKTLEQLIDECEIDLGEWNINRHVVNKWEVGINGGNGIVVEPLFQVKAWLVRRNPEPILPVIQPLESQHSFEFGVDFRNETEQPDRLSRSLVFSCSQIGFEKSVRDSDIEPFHDRKALDVICQIAEVAKPDRIDILGDFIDLPDWSDKFIRSPEFYFTTQPALIEAHWWLSRIRQALPKSEIRLHQGNHEKRLENAIAVHLPAAYDLRSVDCLDLPPAMSIQSLLSLDTLGIEWIGDYPNDDSWLNDNLCLKHGDVVRQAPGDSSKAVVMSGDTSTIFGHTHRLEQASRTRWTRDGAEFMTAVSVGCTCRLDGLVPGRKAKQQWQQGFAMVDYGDHYYNINAIHIDDGRAVWDRCLYIGSGNVDGLRQSYPDWRW
jgi:hypothetical protein